MPTIDWPKLQFQFGDPQKLAFWLNEITAQADVELTLLEEAHQDPQLRTQVVGIFSGIASLLGYSPLMQVCEWLENSNERIYAKGVEQVKECYLELLTQVKSYQQTLPEPPITEHSND